MEEPSPPPKLAPFSSVELHETVVHREPGRPALLGCLSSGKFIEVDETGLRAVEALRERGSIQRAEDALRETAGEDVDVLAFAELLVAKGFVRAIDGVALAEGEAAAKRHRILYRAPPHALRFLRHPLFVAAMMALIGAYLVVLALRPDVRPSFADLSFTPRPALNLSIVFLTSLAFTYVHELAHFAMARSYGVDARIRLSHRLYVPILETDVTNAWILRPSQRLPIFLCGIVVDLALAGVCGVLLALGGVPDAAQPLARLLIVVQLLAVGYQFLFYMRTDLYYVLITALGERNLLADATVHLRHAVARAAARVRGRPAPAALAPAADGRARQLLAWGAVFLVGRIYGLTVGLALAGLFLSRQLLLSVAYARAGWAAGDPWFTAEGVLALAVAGIQLGWLLWFLGSDLVGATRRLLRSRRPVGAVS